MGIFDTKGTSTNIAVSKPVSVETERSSKEFGLGLDQAGPFIGEAIKLNTAYQGRKHTADTKESFEDEVAAINAAKEITLSGGRPSTATDNLSLASIQRHLGIQAADDPTVKSSQAFFSKLAAADRQGKTRLSKYIPELAMTELTKAINASPHFKDEIIAGAKEALGFDPTAADISHSFSVFDAAEASRKAANGNEKDDKFRALLRGNMSANAGEINPKPDSTVMAETLEEWKESKLGTPGTNDFTTIYEAEISANNARPEGQRFSDAEVKKLSLKRFMLIGEEEAIDANFARNEVAGDEYQRTARIHISRLTNEAISLHQLYAAGVPIDSQAVLAQITNNFIQARADLMSVSGTISKSGRTIPGDDLSTSMSLLDDTEARLKTMVETDSFQAYMDAVVKFAGSKADVDLAQLPGFLVGTKAFGQEGYADLMIQYVGALANDNQHAYVKKINALFGIISGDSHALSNMFTTGLETLGSPNAPVGEKQMESARFVYTARMLGKFTPEDEKVTDLTSAVQNLTTSGALEVYKTPGSKLVVQNNSKLRSKFQNIYMNQKTGVSDQIQASLLEINLAGAKKVKLALDDDGHIGIVKGSAPQGFPGSNLDDMFSPILREVESLKESLKLYNQLVDIARVHQGNADPAWGSVVADMIKTAEEVEKQVIEEKARQAEEREQQRLDLIEKNKRDKKDAEAKAAKRNTTMNPRGRE